MRRNVLLTAVTAAVCATTYANAGVTGNFVDLGSNKFGFEITTDTAIYGLDFSDATGSGFSGNFLNTGIDTDFDFVPDSPLTFTPNANLPFAETYFVFAPNAVLAPNQTIRDGIGAYGFLNAAFTNTGSALIDANTTKMVAIFTTSDGIAPIYHGGFAEISAAGGNLVEVAVPEPASLALLGLGGVAVLARRRKA